MAGTKENSRAKDDSTKEPAQGNAKALVAARHARERCAGSEARRLQAEQRQEDRGFAEAIGGEKHAPQGGRLPFGAIDADILYQSRRPEFTESRARPSRAREGGTDASVREGIVGRPRKRRAGRTGIPDDGRVYFQDTWR